MRATFPVRARRRGLRGAGLPCSRQKTAAETPFATTANARAISRTRILRAKHEQQRQQREQRNEQQNQQQSGRRQRGWQRRGKTSRQPPSNGGKRGSYHNTTKHSDAGCRAIKNAKGNAHVAAAQHTCMQGICSMRDIPDPKEDSERPLISFSVTEVLGRDNNF